MHCVFPQKRINVMLLHLWKSLHNGVKLTNGISSSAQCLPYSTCTPQCPSDPPVVDVEFETDFNLQNYFVLKGHLALVS